MAFSLKTECAVPKTHAPRFSCRLKNAYRGLQVEDLGRRFYSPSIGRWASRDPVEEAGSLGLYIACGNTLVTGVDPIGESALPGSSLSASTRFPPDYYHGIMTGFPYYRTNPWFKARVWPYVMSEEGTPCCVRAARVAFKRNDDPPFSPLPFFRPLYIFRFRAEILDNANSRSLEYVWKTCDRRRLMSLTGPYLYRDGGALNDTYMKLSYDFKYVWVKPGAIWATVFLARWLSCEGKDDQRVWTWKGVAFTAEYRVNIFGVTVTQQPGDERRDTVVTSLPED